MTAKIYLFTYNSEINSQTEVCINQRLEKLYDIKHIHNSVQMIKTDDDIVVLEKYLATCFHKKDSYLLVDITEQKNRYKNIQSSDIAYWMDNI